VVCNDPLYDVVGTWRIPSKGTYDRGVRCTLGCSSPRIDEDIVENLETPLLAETRLRGCYRKI